MKEMKRILSLVLCFVMLVGMLPSFAFAAKAAETPVDALVVMSDLHTTKYDMKKSTLQGVLGAIKAAGLPVSSVNSSGDLFSVNESNTVYDCAAAEITEMVQEVFDVPVNYVWTDHDREAADISKKSSLVVYDNYYVYLLSMGDLSSNDRYSAGFAYSEGNYTSRVNAGFTATVPQAIEEFKAAVENLDKTKPLFIVGHQPLFDNRNDNAWAEDWVAAINEVAAEMDVAYFSGHNHNYDFDNSATGKQDYYFAKGSSMPVPKRSDWGFDYNEGSQSNKNLGYTNVTLNFTHVCAGYLSPATGSNDPNTRKGTALAIAIYDDYIKYTIYDKEGVYDTTAAMVVNETVKRDHAKADEPEGTTSNKVWCTAVLNDESEEGYYMEATAPGLTAMTADYVYEEYEDLILETFSDGLAFEVALEGHNADDDVAYYFEKDYYIEDEGLMLYHVGENNELTAIPYELVTEDGGLTYISFTSKLEGVFIYGTVAVPENYVLSELTVDYRGATKYLVGDVLDMVNMTVTAVYTKEGAEDMGKDLYPVSETVSDGYTYTIPDMTTPGVKTITLTYGEVSTSFQVEVFGKNFVHEQTDITVQVTVPGVTGVEAAPVTEGVAFNAAATVLASGFVAYDIDVAGFVNGSGTATVTIPCAVEDAVVYYISDDGTELVPMDIISVADGFITFETDHFTTYAVGELLDMTGDWITITEAVNGTITYAYTQATSITAGGKYVIVANNNAVAFMDNNGSFGSQNVTISGSDGSRTMTSEDVLLTEWTFSGSSNGTVYNGTRYLHYSSNMWSSGFDLSNTSSTLTFTDNGNNFRIYNNASYGTDYSFYYDGSNWTRSNSAQYVRLFVRNEDADVTVGGTAGKYVRLSGNATYTYSVTDGKTVDDVVAQIKQDYSVQTATKSNGSDAKTLEDGDTAITWAWEKEFNGTAGEYYMIVSYTVDGTAYELGAIKVVVNPVVLGLKEGSTSGSVMQYAGKNSPTGILIQVQTSLDGATKDIPVTVGMLRKNNQTVSTSTVTEEPITGLKVIYNGEELAGTVSLTVREKVHATYPEYPEEGAVKVNKTGTGIDFQSTGLARIEISASGVPQKKGVDVIIMLDTSSSMTKNNVTAADGTSKTRAAVLEEALKNLIASLKATDEDGNYMDIKVAIADFNGYYGYSNLASGTPYDRDSTDQVQGGSRYDQGSEAIVYTNGTIRNGSYVANSGTLDATAFLPVQELADSYTLNYTSGTNYDYAFDAIYQLGTAIKVANGEEDRDLVVIFMSDGAALQWNYFTSGHGNDNGSGGEAFRWNKWLAGKWTADDLTTTNLTNTTHSYFYDLNDHDGDGHINEHRMANAIKGSPDDSFEIIRKSTAGLPDGTLTPVMKKDANGNPTNQAYEDLYTVPGLGATMYAINFDAKRDGDIQVDNIDKALASTASDQTGRTQYYYKVTSANELQHAFDTIGSEIAYAASNARFVDQMGPNFNLQLGALKDLNGNKLSGIDNTIEVLAYEIYTLEDYENQVITDIHQVGTRKLDSQGNPIATVIERITFSDDGSEVYSNLIDGGKTNILADGTKEGYVKGVIYAQTFYYNTNNNGVALNGVRIPTGINGDGTTTDKVEGGYTDVLPRETFYWRLGTVQTTELAMRYYVYLDGSMEGTREAGAYATNTFATLYYDNYQNQPCYKDTVSPTMAWKSANVSYAFYLVNSEGEVIVNQATGETGSFANKIAITNPVVFHELLLNDDGITLNVVKAMEVLPDYYDPYDMGASYQVFAKSDGTGSWTIGTTESVPTTYVTMYDMSDPAKYTYLNSTNADGVDYTHTVVWFAVELVTQAHPDTVVIDYGLPVDIDVLSNDMFGTLGTVAGVGAVNESLLPGHTTEMNGAFGNDYTGTYGVANVQGNKVRYTLNTSNGMQMQTYEQFMYAVKYSGNVNPGYYYDTITVIPATTIYYEDNFLTYDSFTWDYSSNDWTAVDKNSDKWTWTQIGNVNGVQAEDRPGEYALTDANNIYGYDKANLSMSTYSMGNAMKATVDYDNYAQASFTFWGTGFDLISMTNSATGTILVDVVREDVVGEEYNRYKIVDTYYGYTKQEDGSWVVTPTAQSIWQVPVIKIDDLTYGKYTVTIKASYDPGFDHVDPSYDINVGFYDFYLDAIRIYDPANDGAAADSDTVIEDAYVLDGEGWPSYFELRNHLLTEESLGNYQVNGENNSKVEVKGVVFIDGNAEVGNAALSEYMSYGPNNEVYLAPGQRVAFILGNVSSNVANIHIGIKSADGKPAQYTFTNIGQGIDVKDGGTGVAAGKWYGAKTETVNTTTDMYYDITAWRGDIIVISNTGDATTGGIISITNIKATYKSNPNGTMVTDETEDPNAGITTASAEDELAGTNEVYAYMTPRAATLTLRALNAPANEEPEQTEPEVPEVTDPVVPETTVPETTVPETTIPEATEPGNTQLKAAVEAAKKLKEKDYTKESFKAVKDALKAAEKVLKDKKASQVKIDAALDALNAAVEALEAKPDTAALQKAVDQAKKLKEKDYTKESFKEFKKVLKDVEKVLKDKNATQAEVDAALEELNEALEALEVNAPKAKPGKK